MMAGLLAIWAACAFWVIVYFEVNRESYDDTLYEFYLSELEYILVAAGSLIFTPIALMAHFYAIHKEGTWK